MKGSHFSNADFNGPSYGIEYELGLGLVKTSIPLEKIKMNTMTFLFVRQCRDVMGDHTPG